LSPMRLSPSHTAIAIATKRANFKLAAALNTERFKNRQHQQTGMRCKHVLRWLREDLPRIEMPFLATLAVYDLQSCPHVTQCVGHAGVPRGGTTHLRGMIGDEHALVMVPLENT
jgi:hypothetical protein